MPGKPYVATVSRWGAWEALCTNGFEGGPTFEVGEFFDSHTFMLYNSWPWEPQTIAWASWDPPAITSGGRRSGDTVPYRYRTPG